MSPGQIEKTKQLTLAAVDKMASEPTVNREKVRNEITKVFKNLCQAVAEERK